MYTSSYCAHREGMALCMCPSGHTEITSCWNHPSMLTVCLPDALLSVSSSCTTTVTVMTREVTPSFTRHTSTVPTDSFTVIRDSSKCTSTTSQERHRWVKYGASETTHITNCLCTIYSMHVQWGRTCNHQCNNEQRVCYMPRLDHTLVCTYVTCLHWTTRWYVCYMPRLDHTLVRMLHA